METIRSVKEFKQWRENFARSAVGFVPTMGALHEGHRKLILQSRTEYEQTVVSIFVNPTQFNQAKDLENYPKPLENDLTLCREIGASVVFIPDANEIYPDDYRYRVTENLESKDLEGEFRPGHFEGVLTVVLKLLMIVDPDKAFFGEKDYQQLRLVEGMVKAFHLNTKICAVPTVRHEDGLAMSSRNVRLSESQREKAPIFHRVLANSKDLSSAHLELEWLGFEVEYIQERWGRRLGAVRLGEVRLIDNVSKENE